MFLPFTNGKRLQQVQETTATDYVPHVTRGGLNREGATATGHKGAAVTGREGIVVIGVRNKANNEGKQVVYRLNHHFYDHTSIPMVPNPLLWFLSLPNCRIVYLAPNRS